MPDVKKLYRSKEDRIIAGVCGGMAEYLNVDPVWIRLVAVLLVFAHGIGILIYILAWILIPPNPHQKDVVTKRAHKVARHERPARKTTPHMKREPGNHAMLLGIVFVFIGGMILLKNLFSWFSSTEKGRH